MRDRRTGHTAQVLVVVIVGGLLRWSAECRAAEPGRGATGSATEIVEPIAASGDSAIQRTLALLETSAAAYIKKRECFSCHHQTLPAVTLALARQSGYEVDASRMAAQAEFTVKYFAARADRLRKGDGVPGGPFTAGYALIGLHAAGRTADDTTSALTVYLFKTQEKSGHWTIRTHRPPLEDSHFAATALALRGIRLLADKAQTEEAARRVASARDWLVQSLDARRDEKPDAKQPLLSNEDRAFRLLGLHWAEADRRAIDRAAADLLDQQRSDGGWAQTSDLASDAYATGQSLAALHSVRALGSGALKADRAASRRGLEFLRKTRQADGSWLVATRSKPIQTYFESDFPHGKSQFISIAGTSWAAQALLLERAER